jgi:hypothetical protein
LLISLLFTGKILTWCEEILFLTVLIGFFCHRILKNKTENLPDYLYDVPIGSQKYRMTLQFFVLSKSINSQNWLNFYINERHLSSITKRFKKTLL